MSKPRPTRLAVATSCAVVLGVAVLAVLLWLWQSTSPGGVALADDDSGTALFTATALKPGASAAKCILVTSTGTLESTVKLYGTDMTATKSLDRHLNLVLEQGTGSTRGGRCGDFVPDPGAANRFAGTLAGFAALHTDFSTGFGTFAPSGAGQQTKIYRITYIVDAAIPNTAQASTASMALTWEARSG